MNVQNETLASLKQQLDGANTTLNLLKLTEEQKKTMLAFKFNIIAKIKTHKASKKQENYFDLFIQQAKKMNGGCELVSFKQAKFFASKLRTAAKQHATKGLEVIIDDDKLEGFINVDFFLDTEDRISSTNYVTIKVRYGRAGKELFVHPGKDGVTTLEIVG